MKLKPAEILQHLGLTVPDEGVEVGEDWHFHTSMLALLGGTLSLQAVSDEAVNRRHDELRRVMQGWGLAAPNTSPNLSPKEAAVMSRASMRVALRQAYGFVDSDGARNRTEMSAT
jgi:hypothetical protein